MIYHANVPQFFLMKNIFACDFCLSSFKLKRYATSLKNYCHIKLKFFLWTKPLESLLLTKYVCCCSFDAKLIKGAFELSVNLNFMIINNTLAKFTVLEQVSDNACRNVFWNKLQLQIALKRFIAWITWYTPLAT